MKQKTTILLYIPALLIGSYWGYVKVALPVVPSLTQVFSIPESTIHRILSLAFFLSGLSGLIWGAIIDYMYIKRFIIMITLLGMIILSISAVSNHFLLWSTCYVFGAILLSGLLVCSRSFVMLYLEKDNHIKKAFSIMVFGAYLSAFLAPFISGWTTTLLNWHYAFLVIPIMLLILLILSLRLGPQLKAPVGSLNIVNNISYMLHCVNEKTIRKLLIMCSATAAILQSYYIAIPFWLVSQYHIKAHNLAYYLLAMLTPGLLTPLIMPMLMEKFSEKTLCVYSAISLILAGLLASIFSVSRHLPSWIWLTPGILISLGTVILLPIVSLHIMKRSEGRYSIASSLLSVVSYVSGGIGIYITSYITLHTFYREAIFIVLATIATIYLLINLRAELN
ncbi:MAG: MFS transporter [Pseudomonadota bacterium]